MTILEDDAHRRWAALWAAFAAGGALGAVLVGLVVDWLPGVETPLAPLVAATAVLVPVVGLPLWHVVVRPPRAGPGWGALVAAWIPAILTAATAGVALAVGDLSAAEVGRAAALLYLTATPLTLLLAAVGAGLATWGPRRPGS